MKENKAIEDREAAARTKARGEGQAEEAAAPRRDARGDGSARAPPRRGPPRRGNALEMAAAMMGGFMGIPPPRFRGRRRKRRRLGAGCGGRRDEPRRVFGRERAGGASAGELVRSRARARAARARGRGEGPLAREKTRRASSGLPAQARAPSGGAREEAARPEPPRRRPEVEVRSTSPVGDGRAATATSRGRRGTSKAPRRSDARRREGERAARDLVTSEDAEDATRTRTRTRTTRTREGPEGARRESDTTFVDY